MIVSGYFYHKRGAEAWSNITNPNESDWKVVNGCIPKDMGEGNSFSSYLQGLNKEDGLIAEIEFRTKHFDSMMEWPMDDPRIKIYKYEDLLSNEKDIFKDIMRFYEVTLLENRLASILAERFSAKKQKGKIRHIRNSKPSQWKEHFTPKVEDYFDRKYPELLERYDYS